MYDHIMPLNPDDLRHAMRQWATGVTVVTAQSAGVRHGMTVSSFTSLSLEPPLVLVSLEQTAKTYRLVQEARHFGVTVLSQEQVEISNRFAGRIPDGEDRFAGLESFSMISGAPLLQGGLAWFDCVVIATYPAGNHTVFIGEVLAAQTGDPASPLLYYDRDYRNLEKK